MLFEHFPRFLSNKVKEKARKVKFQLGRVRSMEEARNILLDLDKHTALQVIWYLIEEGKLNPHLEKGLAVVRGSQFLRNKIVGFENKYCGTFEQIFGNRPIEDATTDSEIANDYITWSQCLEKLKELEGKKEIRRNTMLSREQITEWVNELQESYTGSLIGNKQKFTGYPMREENIHDDVRVYADILGIDSKVTEIFLENKCYDMSDDEVVELILSKLENNHA